MTATVYPGITTDCDIEERRQSIATEKRCDNQLTATATATAMATVTATDGKHWVAGGVASGGSGNEILLWRITR
jgi:hypothetical protein